MTTTAPTPPSTPCHRGSNPTLPSPPHHQHSHRHHGSDASIVTTAPTPPSTPCHPGSNATQPSHRHHTINTPIVITASTPPSSPRLQHPHRHHAPTQPSQRQHTINTPIVTTAPTRPSPTLLQHLHVTTASTPTRHHGSNTTRVATSSSWQHNTCGPLSRHPCRDNISLVATHLSRWLLDYRRVWQRGGSLRSGSGSRRCASATSVMSGPTHQRHAHHDDGARGTICQHHTTPPGTALASS
jgi:hypothetical protein